MGQVRTERDEQLLAIAREVAATKRSIPWSENYEKMISGMFYDSLAEPLVQARYESRRAVQKFNNLYSLTCSREQHEEEAKRLLTSILGRVGEDCWIESFQADYGFNVLIGNRFYANFNLILLDCSLIMIGDRVMCGPNVSLLAATHPTEVHSRRKDVDYSLPIYIGDDCWLGAGVTVLGGVTIGKGCTIGAGAVVTKDIPDFAIAVGVPAKVVGKVDEVD